MANYPAGSKILNYNIPALSNENRYSCHAVIAHQIQVVIYYPPEAPRVMSDLVAVSVLYITTLQRGILGQSCTIDHANYTDQRREPRMCWWLVARLLCASALARELV